MKKIIILLFISALGTITACEKNNKHDLNAKKFKAYVVGTEGTCYSWQIKFVEDRTQLNQIMSKDS